jgi:hypothetical protein
MRSGSWWNFILGQGGFANDPRSCSSRSGRARRAPDTARMTDDARHLSRYNDQPDNPRLTRGELARLRRCRPRFASKVSPCGSSDLRCETAADGTVASHCRDNRRRDRADRRYVLVEPRAELRERARAAVRAFLGVYRWGCGPLTLTS